MITARPIPFRDAVALLRARRLLPTQLDSIQLLALEADVRRYATFSAKVTDASFLQRIHDSVSRIVEPRIGGAPGEYMGRATARLALKEALREIGYAAEPGAEGTIEDLASDARTDLIIRMNTELAQGFGQHVQANSPGVLEAFPAQELYRLAARNEERPWLGARWPGSGGKIYAGDRMIAPKDDPVWARLSAFGHPYPPFDYNSGMWVRPISRAEAVRLGVIPPHYRAVPSPVAFAPPPEVNVKSLNRTMEQILRSALDAR